MSMNREAKELYQDQVTRWRRLWAVTFGALILVLGSGAVTVNLLLDASRVRNRELSQIDQVIQEISDNQAGIDELVSFVRDVAETQNEEEFDLTVFIDLLCSSEDPARQAACAALPPNLQPKETG